MKYLLDIQVLLWAAAEPDKLSSDARDLIANPEHQMMFSVASLWEVSIKSSLNRPDFRHDSRVIRRGLLDNDYAEIDISGEHAVALNGLPMIHKDPFDRMLIAQSMVEGITLITADELVARYPGPILKI